MATVEWVDFPLGATTAKLLHYTAGTTTFSANTQYTWGMSLSQGSRLYFKDIVRNSDKVASCYYDRNYALTAEYNTSYVYPAGSGYSINTRPHLGPSEASAGTAYFDQENNSADSARLLDFIFLSLNGAGLSTFSDGTIIEYSQISKNFALVIPAVMEDAVGVATFGTIQVSLDNINVVQYPSSQQWGYAEVTASGTITWTFRTGTNQNSFNNIVSASNDIKAFMNLPPPVTTFRLTVNNGSGSGSYAENAEVQIQATSLSPNPFKQWRIDSGNITFVNSTERDATAIVRMPASNASITAMFFDASDADPYGPGGDVTVPDIGPTGGTWTQVNDTVSISPYQSTDLLSGLFRVYAMNAGQIVTFASNLWNPNILQQLGNFFENPTEIVMSLMSFPFKITSAQSTVSNISFSWLTDWAASQQPTGYELSSEYQVLNGGQIVVPRYSDTFYDYQPYSSAQLYLPYVGFVPVKMNEILGRIIYITYNVNLVSGEAECIVRTVLIGDSKLNVIGVYPCVLGRSLPVSQRSFLDVYMKGMDAAISVGTAVAAGVGAVGSAVASARAKSEVEARQQDVETAEDNDVLRDAKFRLRGAQYEFRRAKRAVGANVRRLYSGVQSAIGDVANANGQIMRSGSFNSVLGRLSPQTAFLLVSMPHQNVTTKQNLLGYSTNIAGTLAEFSGYTEVRTIRLNVPVATENELHEIDDILRGGIVI